MFRGSPTKAEFIKHCGAWAGDRVRLHTHGKTHYALTRSLTADLSPQVGGKIFKWRSTQRERKRGTLKKDQINLFIWLKLPLDYFTSKTSAQLKQSARRSVARSGPEASHCPPHLAGGALKGPMQLHVINNQKGEKKNTTALFLQHIRLPILLRLRKKRKGTEEWCIYLHISTSHTSPVWAVTGDGHSLSLGWLFYFIKRIGFGSPKLILLWMVCGEERWGVMHGEIYM